MTKEKQTDLWVYELLKQANIKFDAQGSSNKEIDEALKTASKNGKGNIGRPEYVAVVKSDDNDDFVLVIEDKRDVSRHVKYDDDGLLTTDVRATVDYAVNGAYFYGKHILENTNYKRVFAIGVSGSESHHKITPIFVGERNEYLVLEDVLTFEQFNSKNIKRYYLRNVLKQNLDDLELQELMKSAEKLNNLMRSNSVSASDRSLVVSGILLALKSSGQNLVNSLIGNKKDGEKIYDAIKYFLDANCEPQVKADIVLRHFSLLRDNVKLNEYNDTYGKSALKLFTEFIYENLYKKTVETHDATDILGKFYGEFVKYANGDANEKGIVLTPVHITTLMNELVDIKYTDRVFDPCTGTAGFLVSAMHRMLHQTDDDYEKLEIKRNRLYGVELEEKMYTIAVTNMILRGDGKTNLKNDNFLKLDERLIKSWGCNKCCMNPPYSMAAKTGDKTLYEILFIEKALDCLTVGGKLAVIIPLSTMTGKTKIEKEAKERIFSKHTLEGVITCNKDTFFGVGTVTCIAVFTTGIPHPRTKVSKFINFENDGFVVRPHIGLCETDSAIDKKEYLLDVWNERINAPTKFCVKTTVNADDEWLHSFYYFNDELPTEEDFDKTIGDYLTFEFSQIMQGRGDLFGKER